MHLCPFGFIVTFGARSMRAAFVVGATSRAIAIPLRLFSVPLALSLLSGEQYGLWLVVLSVITWLSFSDLGIPSALQNRLVHVLQLRDRERARGVVAYAAKLLTWMALAMGVCGSALLWILPQSWFAHAQAVEPQVKAMLVVVLLAFCCGLPGRLGGVILAAHGRLSWLPFSELVAQVASFFLLLVLVAMQWKSLLVLVACYALSSVVIPVVLTVFAFRVMGYSVSVENSLSGEDRRALLGQGGFFLVTTLGELLILHSDPLLIGAVAGMAQVPLFMIPAALWVNFLQAQNIFLRPLWPVLANAWAGKDVMQLKAIVRRALILSLVAAACLAGVLVVGGDWFVQLWSRRVASLPPVMAWGFAFYVVAASVDNLLAVVLNATGYIKQRFFYTAAFGIVKVLAGWLTLETLGIEFLPATYALVMTLVSLPFAVMLTRRAIAQLQDCGGRVNSAR